jgi:hypothetical protein
MAGESLLPVTETSDYLASTVTLYITDISSIVASTTKIPLFYCERNTIVDAAFTWWESSDDTVSGIALEQEDGTNITDTINTQTSVNPVQIVYPFTIVETENFVPAGNFIMAETTDLNTTDYLAVQMRIRTRVR